jgi:hypothetical protein
MMVSSALRIIYIKRACSILPGFVLKANLWLHRLTRPIKVYCPSTFQLSTPVLVVAGFPEVVGVGTPQV